jgi:methylated-DNA-[protein]-cysteine S-methyltransferase
MSDHLVSTTIETPIGPLTLVASAVGLRAVLWPDDDPARGFVWGTFGRRCRSDARGDGGATRRVLRRLAPDFDVPLDPVGTDFQRAAWAVLREIPFGTTISYAEQAERMGDRRKARAVGGANGRNPLSIVVPCHRVVGSAGRSPDSPEASTRRRGCSPTRPR